MKNLTRYWISTCYDIQVCGNLPPILSEVAKFTPILSEIMSLFSLTWGRKGTHVLPFSTHTSG